MDRRPRSERAVPDVRVAGRPAQDRSDGIHEKRVGCAAGGGQPRDVRDGAGDAGAEHQPVQRRMRAPEVDVGQSNGLQACRRGARGDWVPRRRHRGLEALEPRRGDLAEQSRLVREVRVRRCVANAKPARQRAQREVGAPIAVEDGQRLADQRGRQVGVVVWTRRLRGPLHRHLDTVNMWC